MIKNKLQAGFIPHISKLCGGFTMVELLVSMTIFMILVTAVIGGFVNAIKNQRIVTDAIAVNSNAGLALEQIAREIRTGYNFPAAGSSCGNQLSFTNYRGNQVTFRLNNDTVERKECNKVDCSASVFNPLTAANVLVNNLCFLVQQQSNCSPWFVVITVGVASKTADYSKRLVNVQTSISPRILPSEQPGFQPRCS